MVATVVRSLPGTLRRTAAGAWHVPGGFLFLVRRPRLLPMAALPAFIAAASVLCSLGLVLYAGPNIEAALTPAPDRVPTPIAALLAVSVWLATLITALALGLAAALLLAAPVLDLLSKEALMEAGEITITKRRRRRRKAPQAAETVEAPAIPATPEIKQPVPHVPIVPIAHPTIGTAPPA